MAPSIQNELELIVGSTRPVVLEVYDLGVLQSLATATRAHLVIGDYPGSATPIVDVTTADQLSIQAGLGTVTYAPTSGQANAWTRGEYVGQLNVEFGAGNWRPSDRFRVMVRMAVAGALP